VSDLAVHPNASDLENGPVNPDSPHRAFVLGSRLRFGLPGRLDLSCISIIVAVIALPLRGLYAATGSTMEEGFMLYFPERIIRGDIPNVDFLHLYGPGSLDALVGWYGLFGHSLASERTFGLLQHLGVIFGIYALSRAWGRVAATICALTCTVIVLTPIGLSAMAWEGGIALGVWSLVFAVRAYNISGGADALSGHSSLRRCAIAAGAFAGAALSFRPDLVIALALAHGWLLWRRHRSSIRQFVLGVAVGLLPLFVHLAVAGVGPSFRGMVIDPVVHLRPGRALPVPPSWNHFDAALQWIAEQTPPWWGIPSIAWNRQLFFWFFAMLFAIAANLLVARRALKLGNLGGRGVALMMGALFGLGILPQAMQRPDSTHLAWVVCVCFALLPVTIIEVLALKRPQMPVRRRLVASFATIAALLLVVCPFFTLRMYVLHARVSVGNKPVPFHVQRNGREFWMGNGSAAQASRELIVDLQSQMKAGQRLLVGPADLSRTIYSDVMFYWMFPELKPATYYIEMDPGLADKAGSSLAADVRSADWLILTNFWTGWHENNASDHFGSKAPNQVVASDFCLVRKYGQRVVPSANGDYLRPEVLLYRRCATGDGVSPAEVGEKLPPASAATG
jgi:hypothetical protein